MRANGCSVTGIERSPRLADEVRAYCEDVIVADLDSRSLADVLPERLFDVVVFGDILDRVRNPGRLLDEARALLAPEGLVVLSIPDPAQDLRVAALETEEKEAQALLRMREDTLLALIEQRATLEFDTRERVAQVDRDLAASADREAELIRTGKENAERIAQLELEAAGALERQHSLSAELAVQRSAVESAVARFDALEQNYRELLGDFEKHVAEELEEIRRGGHEIHEMTRAIQRSPFWSLKLGLRRLYRFGRD